MNIAGIPPVQLTLIIGGMPVEAKKVFERVKMRGEPTKQKVTLYLDIALYKDVKKLCDSEDSSVSEVVEDLLRELVESAQKAKK